MSRLLDGQDLVVFVSGECPIDKTVFEVRYMLLTWHGGGGLVCKIENLGWVGETHMYHVGHLDSVDEGNIFAFVWGVQNG